MTLGPLFFATLAGVLLVIGFGLLVRPLKAETAIRPARAVNLENLSARHFRYLSQFRQVLSGDDREFIENRLSQGNARLLRAQRREAVRKYLVGIGEDFACLDRLAREVASLSPKVDHKQEIERLRQEIQFRILYRIALFRLGTVGSIPFETAAQLSNIVGGLSRQVDSMMAALQPVVSSSPAQNPSHL
jgi:hypothetical protein